MESNLSVIIRFIALALILVIAATIPFKKKKLQKELGECRLPLTRKNSILFIAVILFAPLLIILQWLRDFAPYIDIILSAGAVLAVKAVISEHLYNTTAGVYNEYLVVDGRKLPKKEIVSFPTLAWENNPDSTEEDNPALTDPQYKRALKIVTENNGVIFVGFENEEERNAAVSILREWTNE